jgi:hypothetical protein
MVYEQLGDIDIWQIALDHPILLADSNEPLE